MTHGFEYDFLYCVYEWAFTTITDHTLLANIFILIPGGLGTFVHQDEHFTASHIGAMEGLDRFNYIIKLHKKRKNPMMRNLLCP